MSEKDQEYKAAQMGVDDTQTIGPGSRLRMAREAARISLAEVAKHLHLTAHLIADIENDDYTRSPSFVFIRGYLRAYANLVQVPADEIIQDFNRLGLEEAPSNRPKRRFTHRRGHTENWISWLGLMMLLGVVTLAAFWWSHHRNAAKTQPVASLSSASGGKQTQALTVPQQVKSATTAEATTRNAPKAANAIKPIPAQASGNTEFSRTKPTTTVVKKKRRAKSKRKRRRYSRSRRN